MGHLSYWDQIAGSVLVEQLQFPVGPALDASMRHEQAVQALEDYCDREDFEPEYCTCVVYDSGKALGWWTVNDCKDQSPQETIRLRMHRLWPTQILSAEHTFVDLIEAFSKLDHGMFFVADEGVLAGTVEYYAISYSIAKGCWYALVSELEEVSLSLCDHFAEQCWQGLALGQQLSARSSLAKHLDKEDKRFIAEIRPRFAPHKLPAVNEWNRARRPTLETPRALLAHTGFREKGNMISTHKLLPDWSASEISKLWEQALAIRNICAHGTGSEAIDMALPRNSIGEFVSRCSAFVESVYTAMPK